MNRFGLTGCALLALAALSARAAAPANDRFSSRIAITSTNITVLGSNVGATKESGEPNHAGNVGGSSVWWSWTAPTNGELRVTTDGSDFDTLLGVYTGPRANALTVIATNDDHGAQGTVTSRVRFPSITGKESDRSAPSGMQISLHTSQSARAAKVIEFPLRKSGRTLSSLGSSTSPW